MTEYNETPSKNIKPSHPLAAVGPLDAGLSGYFASNWVETVEEGVSLLASAPEQFPGRAAFMAAAAQLLGPADFALSATPVKPRATGCLSPEEVKEPVLEAPRSDQEKGGNSHAK